MSPWRRPLSSELRASDFFGRLHNGPLGGPARTRRGGGRAVRDGRLKARAAQIAPPVAAVMQVGGAVFTPECASADDLIADAKGQCELSGLCTEAVPGGRKCRLFESLMVGARLETTGGTWSWYGRIYQGDSERQPHTLSIP